uniref:HTH myb-type domain-containing protein n=1 Tax=Brassica oleracea TaxID=3712 RepID=A0A3P6GEH8_BRAOL|nr:unnamed protein product [Brassica oleracea]
MEKAIERQRVLLEHLCPSSSHSIEGSLTAFACLAGDSAAYQRTSLYGDDVVIVAAHRTALCKSKRGNFKDTFPDDHHFASPNVAPSSDQESGGRNVRLGLNRIGKICRLRWVNYLHSGLKRGKMTQQEERLVLELHAK